MPRIDHLPTAKEFRDMARRVEALKAGGVKSPIGCMWKPANGQYELFIIEGGHKVVLS